MDNYSEQTSDKKTLRKIEEVNNLKKELSDYEKYLGKFRRMIADKERALVDYSSYDEVESLDFTELNEKVDKVQNTLDMELTERIRRAVEDMKEFNHTECIKVYRNVQAVVVEEDAKQNKFLNDLGKDTDKIKGKMNLVMIFSVISFITSILVMLLLILPKFGINIM